MSNIIPIPARREPPIDLALLGTHRGGTAALDHVHEFQRRSGRELDVVMVDAHRGRAHAVADAARKRGLASRAIEARVESVLDETKTAMPLLHVDQPDTIRRTFEHIKIAPRPVAGLVNLQVPRFGFMSLAFLIEPGSASLARATDLMRAAEAIAGREGSSAVFGPGTAAQSLEPRVRAWYGGLLAGNLGRLASGLPAETPAPLMATLDTLVTRPVAVLRGTQLDEDDDRVAQRVGDERHFSMRRNLAFTVIEVVSLPEPTLRFRNGLVHNNVVQVGRARDLNASLIRRDRAVRDARSRSSGIGRASLGSAVAVTALAGIVLTD